LKQQLGDFKHWMWYPERSTYDIYLHVHMWIQISVLLSVHVKLTRANNRSTNCR